MYIHIVIVIFIIIIIITIIIIINNINNAIIIIIIIIEATGLVVDVELVGWPTTRRIKHEHLRPDTRR